MVNQKFLKGEKIINLIKNVFHLHRSILGKDNLKTLQEFKKINPKLKIYYVKTGTKVFDWTIPKVWECIEAKISEINGKILVNFKENNLHVISYSRSVNKIISHKELLKKLHSIPTQPKAIPYITSYYKSNWGFCISEIQKKKFNKKKYKIEINSKFYNGFLNYAEILIPGKSKKEIIFTSYICHPSMANNELAGPAILVYLSTFIANFKNKKYSYRFIFAPETIGAVTYISKNITKLKKNTIAGFVVTCIGDSNQFSFVESKENNSEINNIMHYIFKNKLNIKNYNFLPWAKDRSDSRQYSSNGVNLPFVTISRAGPGKYKEYHTSQDSLKKVVNKKNVEESYNVLKKIFIFFEREYLDQRPLCVIKCEPFLQKYDLYDSLSVSGSVNSKIRNTRLFLAYSDGKNTLFNISQILNLTLSEIKKIVKVLLDKKLISLK